MLIKTDTDRLPKLYDVLSFVDKPELGMNKEVSFIGEWESTLKDEPNNPSSYTIEHEFFIEAIQTRNRYKYIVLDIESLESYHDCIAAQYVKLAQAAAPRSNISWWNIGPHLAFNIKTDPKAREAWSAGFDLRKGLVETTDFGTLGMYFSGHETFESWRDRQIPRITEARRLFQERPVFAALSPHVFSFGNPWQHIDGAVFGAALDSLVDWLVDGVILWSFEGTNSLQTWDESWPWVQALRDRIGPDGSYQVPA